MCSACGHVFEPPAGWAVSAILIVVGVLLICTRIRFLVGSVSEGSDSWANWVTAMVASVGGLYLILSGARSLLWARRDGGQEKVSG